MFMQCFVFNLNLLLTQFDKSQQSIHYNSRSQKIHPALWRASHVIRTATYPGYPSQLYSTVPVGFIITVSYFP